MLFAAAESAAPLSILVPDMPTVGRYARGVSTPVFRMMKRVLPGAYTFVFPASPEVPKIMLRKRRTIGIRMPNHPIPLEVLAQLSEPLLSTSIRNPDGSGYRPSSPSSNGSNRNSNICICTIRYPVEWSH